MELWHWSPSIYNIYLASHDDNYFSDCFRVYQVKLWSTWLLYAIFRVIRFSLLFSWLLLYVCLSWLFWRKAVLDVPQDVLPDLTYITLAEWPRDVGQKKVEEAGQKLDVCIFHTIVYSLYKRLLYCNYMCLFNIIFKKDMKKRIITH